MSNLGWVKLHRSMLDWEWYSDVNVCRLFMHFILVANHKDGNWRGIEIKRGQRLTSLNKLESETGLTKGQIRTAIKKLISTNEIAQQSHAQHTVFTVINYDSYQGDDTQIDTSIASESHASDTPMTPNKNVKNENNENKLNVSAEPKPSKFKFNDEQMRFAQAVYKKVEQVTPQMKEPNLESWANTARLMVESDKFDLRDVWNVFLWANSDSFWRTNILSVDKLRKKCPELKAKAQGFTQKQQPARPQHKEFKL